MKRSEPKLEDKYLCWEASYDDALLVIDQIKQMHDDARVVTAESSPTGHLIQALAFLCDMGAQLQEVEEEHKADHAEWLKFNERQETRVVNEEQLQEAVAFLTAVWKGEITDATMEQVAAARCFMRAE